MDPRTVQAAEQQMRRTAPDEHTAKRRKVDDGSHQSVARYNYTSVGSLQKGAEGFIVTCPFRKEKSATKEATELLSTYLDRNLAALQKQHEAPLADSSPDAISVAEQPSNALDSSSHATPQTATHPACHFSMTKLASSGIVMLQLLTHASKQEADTDTDKQLLLGTDKSGTDTDRQLLPGTSKQGTDTDTDTYKQLLPGTSKQGTDTDTDKQLLSGTDKQFTATDKQLLPGTSQKGTDTATDKQLLPGSTQAGTDTDKELAVSTSTSDKGWTKHLQVPGTSKQGTDAVNSADIAPVDHRAEVPGHAVTGTGLILPSHQPAKVVQQILDDLQAGRLNPPQSDPGLAAQHLVLLSYSSCFRKTVCAPFAPQLVGHFEAVQMVRDLTSVKHNDQQKLRFCERIMPVQLTCVMTVPSLKSAAGRLAAQHAGEAVKAAAGSSVKLAVAYKGRGRSGKDKSATVDRDRAIAVVASAAESAIRCCGGSVQVDLNSPQAVIMVEVLPMTPDPFFALCWLPGTLVQAKKLVMKPLLQLQQASKHSS